MTFYHGHFGYKVHVCLLFISKPEKIIHVFILFKIYLFIHTFFVFMHNLLQYCDAQKMMYLWTLNYHFITMYV